MELQSSQKKSKIKKLYKKKRVVSTLFEGGGGIKLVNMLDLPKISVIQPENLGRSNYKLGSRFSYTLNRDFRIGPQNTTPN